MREIRPASRKFPGFGSRADSNAPLIERRSGRRYLTLKNFGLVAIVVVLLFLGITIRSEMRGPGSSDFGRLMNRELPVVEQKPLEVVTEADPYVVSAGQRSADPMLVQPMARENWLIDEAAVAQRPLPDRGWETQTRLGVTSSEPGGLTVVGGPDGVEIRRTEARRPVLSGGFGR
jgi:hypothetical protein